MVISAIIFIFVILVIAAAILYPYVWGMVLKARMLRDLREAVRGAGFKYRRLYKNIFLVKNRSSRYDVIVYNDETLYAVKLWSAYFVDSTLVLSKKGRFFEQRETRRVFNLEENGKKYIKGRSHSMPKTRLAKKYTVGRKLERILLIYPSYKDIVFFDGKTKTHIKTKDELFGKTVYSPFAFKNTLREEYEKTLSQKGDSRSESTDVAQ